eukprot:62676-Pleurochrysis_carterae.AAC.1
MHPLTRLSLSPYLPRPPATKPFPTSSPVCPVHRRACSSRGVATAHKSGGGPPAGSLVCPFVCVCVCVRMRVRARV